MTGSDPEKGNFANLAQPRRIKINYIIKYRRIKINYIMKYRWAKNDIHAGCYRKGTV
jgi:hypothetical protein